MSHPTIISHGLPQSERWHPILTPAAYSIGDTIVPKPPYFPPLHNKWSFSWCKLNYKNRRKIQVTGVQIPMPPYEAYTLQVYQTAIPQSLTHTSIMFKKVTLGHMPPRKHSFTLPSLCRHTYMQYLSRGERFSKFPSVVGFDYYYSKLPSMPQLFKITSKHAPCNSGPMQNVKCRNYTNEDSSSTSYKMNTG